MIALDSSAVICLVEHHEPAARHISSEILSHEDRIVVSTVALTECLVGPLKANDRELYWRYKAFFDQPQVQVRDLSSSIAEQAAALRATFGLKVIDSIHLATAIECRADKFVSTDQNDFARCIGHVDLAVRIIARTPDRN